MATQKIQLTEAQLRDMIKQVIYESINEGDIDEGWLSNMWGGVKNAAQSTGQAIAQRGNKFMADYNAGAASSAAKDVEAQIQKSQQVIAREQEKINQLRAKYNQYVNNADKYIGKANTNAANRGSNTRYNQYDITQDTRNKDFFDQNDVNRSNFSARMKGAQQAHRNMRKPAATKKPTMKKPTANAS